MCMRQIMYNGSCFFTKIIIDLITNIYIIISIIYD